MLYLKVPRKEAEKTRRKLTDEGAISNEYGIVNQGDFVLLPVIKPVPSYDFELVEMDAQKRGRETKTLKEGLSGILTENELESLTTSFDIVGDIAIVEIPPALESKEKEIGQSLLRVHKNLKTVLKKLGGMEGEFRVRKFACIAGENRTQTVYRENGLRMRLDLSKMYFSPRLATERKRIAALVGDNERVLVLFAGVGPFALVIAKDRPGSEIVAVELNPDAITYMKENIVLNKVKNVEPVEGDAKSFTGKNFDRVIMPLPKSAHEFLEVAFACLKDGGTVHFYTMAGAGDPIGEATKKAEAEAQKSGLKIEKTAGRIVRPYSPSMVQVVLDLKIKK